MKCVNGKINELTHFSFSFQGSEDEKSDQDLVVDVANEVISELQRFSFLLSPLLSFLLFTVFMGRLVSHC